MNRKLHNTVTALAATTGLLVLSLMAANPAAAPVPMPATFEYAAATSSVDHAVQARHAAEAAKRIEARAATLEARLAEAKAPEEALGEIVGFAAEAATMAAIAAALDEAGAVSTVPAPAATAPRKRSPGRQSVAMPFFSFAPRG